MPWYWKLTESETLSLIHDFPGLISQEDVLRILAASLAREPRQFAEKTERQYLNKAKTIWVQSIHFYGGEHFGKPNYYTAEITHTTTNSAFSRWLNQNNLHFLRHKMPFTY